MTITLKVRLSGASRLRQNLQRIADGMASGADYQQAAVAAAHVIKDEAIAEVPVLTGALQNSIGVALEGERGAQVRTTGIWYAAKVEFVPSRRRGHPFMGPSLEKKRKAATNAAVQFLKTRWGLR